MSVQVPPNCDLTLGLVCVDKSEPGVSMWQMRVDERFLNPAGIVQGGFLAAALDSAMGASAVTSTRGKKVSVANTEMKISFIRSAQSGDILTCTARVLKPGTTIAFVEGRIENQKGDLVATASSTYLIRERAVG